MIIYISFFIVNKKHKNGGNYSSICDYYRSIIEHIKKFIKKQKILLLWLDSDTKKKILNMIDIQIPNNIIILTLEYEETYMYKTYNNEYRQKILNNELILAPWSNKSDLEIESNLTKEELILRRDNLLKTLFIWNTKFELFQKAKKYIQDNKLFCSHLYYLDCGIWKSDRVRFIKSFNEAEFSIHTLNNIMVNSTPRIFIDLPINYHDLLYKGAYEVAAGHLCLSCSIVDNFFEKFKRIFIDINTKYNLITTEQRYLRLILLEYNIEDITFYRNNNGCTYTIDFHNPPLNY